MGHIDYLQPVLILLFSAIIGVSLAQKLKLSPILGYFIAGLVIGPFGLRLIGDSAPIAAIAEIGVAFLLFDIGLHLSFRTIWESKKDFFGLGPAQIFGASLLISLASYMLLKDLTAALVIGCALSLSSTAVAIQTLQDSREQNTPLGRSALAVLIAQDIFVVFLLILLPNLGNSVNNIFPLLGLALLKAVAALLAVVLVGRFLLRPVFEWITSTKNSEVFTASALLFVLASAWGISQLGLSLALGAFLAGLALSESDFCYLVKTEIYPFRGLLLGLFFITVGMSLNWPLAIQSAGMVLILLAAILTLKTLALWGTARLSGYCQGFAIRLGLLLSQGSEFAFVILTLATVQGIVPARLGQILQLAVGLSLAVTPLLAWAGRIVSQRIEQGKIKTQVTVQELSPATTQANIIITGFDLIGQEIAKVLEAEGIGYIAYDGDRQRIAQARSKGFQVEYSDSNRPKTASAASVGNAKIVIILLEDPEVSLNLVDALQQMSPAIPIYAAAEQMSHFNQLSTRNLSDVLIKNHQSAALIVEGILRHLSFPDEKIQDRLARMRRESESLAIAV